MSDEQISFDQWAKGVVSAKRGPDRADKVFGSSPAEEKSPAAPPLPSREAPKPARRGEKSAAQEPNAKAGAAHAEAKKKTDSEGAQGKPGLPTEPRPKADGGTKRNTSRGRTRQPRKIHKGTMNKPDNRRSE